MKRLIAVLVCFILLIRPEGCSSNNENKEEKREIVNENFYCKVIDENNIAIGGLKTYPENGAVFFPEQIEGYTVSKLGYNSPLRSGGPGYLYTGGIDDPFVKRYYFPHTIKEAISGYTSHLEMGLKMFYCGEVINLSCIDGRKSEVYVPAEKYELFNQAKSKYFYGSLLKANVSYHLNYDEDNYYYVDYYENGEKILYVPPIPQRDGYTFGGWFKEAECINQWDFDVDTLQLSEDIEEIKLYAKWIAEQ